MSVITFVCAGQMNSAITFPAFENGHEVRLVGSLAAVSFTEARRFDCGWIG